MRIQIKDQLQIMSFRRNDTIIYSCTLKKMDQDSNYYKHLIQSSTERTKITKKISQKKRSDNAPIGVFHFKKFNGKFIKYYYFNAMTNAEEFSGWRRFVSYEFTIFLIKQIKNKASKFHIHL